LISATTKARCVSSSTPALIVRNLLIVKERRSRPRRCWRNTTQPAESSLMAIAIAANTGASKSRRMPATTMSSARHAAAVRADSERVVTAAAGPARLRASMLLALMSEERSTTVRARG
jgi:hypothetical protein